jgi:hypothetical protein
MLRILVVTMAFCETLSHWNILFALFIRMVNPFLDLQDLISFGWIKKVRIDKSGLLWT